MSNITTTTTYYCPRDLVPITTTQHLCDPNQDENIAQTATLVLAIVGAITVLPGLIASAIAIFNHFPISYSEWKLSEFRVLACAEQATALFIICTLRATASPFSTVGSNASVSITFCLWYTGLIATNYLSSIHKFGGLKHLVHSQGINNISVTKAFDRLQIILGLVQILACSVVLVCILLTHLYPDLYLTWCALLWMCTCLGVFFNSTIALIAATVVLRECNKTWSSLSEQQRQSTGKVITYLQSSRTRHIIALTVITPGFLLVGNVIPCEITHWVFSAVFAVGSTWIMHPPFAYIKSHPSNSSKTTTSSLPSPNYLHQPPQQNNQPIQQPSQQYNKQVSTFQESVTVVGNNPNNSVIIIRKDYPVTSNKLNKLQNGNTTALSSHVVVGGVGMLKSIIDHNSQQVQDEQQQQPQHQSSQIEDIIPTTTDNNHDTIINEENTKMIMSTLEDDENATSMVIFGNIKGKGDVSILTEREIDLVEQDTFGYFLFPRLSNWLLTQSDNPIQNKITWMIVIILYLTSQVIVTLVLLGIWPPIIAITQLLNAIIVMFILSICISRRVLNLMVQTSFFRIRLGVAIITFILLCMTFGSITTTTTSDDNNATIGFRACVVPSLSLLHIGSFLGDAFVQRARFLRWIVYCTAIIPTTIFLVLIMTNSVNNASNYIVPLVGTFSFSTLQFCRDSLFVTIVLLLFESRFLYRGGDLKRFQHLSRPVTREIIPIQDSEFTAVYHADRHLNNRIHHKPVGGVHQPQSMIVASGFFMAKTNQNKNQLSNHIISGTESVVVSNQQPASSHHRPRRIYVDHVAIYEYDAVVFHIFGESKGRYLFQILNHSALTFSLWLINAVMMLFCLVTLSATYDPISREILCILLIIMEIIVTIRETLLKSKSLLQLMIQRPAFWTQVFGIIVWLIGCSIALTDIRIIYPICLSSQIIQFLLIDTTIKPFRWSRNVLLQFIIGIYVIAFTMMIMTQVIHVEGFPFVALGSQFKTLDDPQVFDIVQTTLESGLTIGVTILMRTLWTLIWFEKNTFLFVSAPLRPKFYQ
jgi:hypothetical protein